MAYNFKDFDPQIGNEPLLAGDSVTCGLCLNILASSQAQAIAGFKNIRQKSSQACQLNIKTTWKK